MRALPVGQQAHAVTGSTRGRHAFSLVTLFVVFVLFGWGGFVTSIDAGMAVPDWPTTFGSWNPFMPSPQWWEAVPVLAEHGHRLLATLVGLLTIVLAVWTWRGDDRRWMHKLGWFALGLVIFQGVLGGLRVVLDSPLLAGVHQIFGQLFLSTIVALAVFTAPAWLRVEKMPSASEAVETLKTWAVAVPSVLIFQIALGAIVRHTQQPAGGIIPPPSHMLTGLHIAGGVAVVALVVVLFLVIRKHFKGNAILWRGSVALHGLVVVQFLLGFTAYFVLMAENGEIRSTAQVVINTGHLLVAAGLMAVSVTLALWALRVPAPAPHASTAPPLR